MEKIVISRFNYIKKLINNKDDEKILIDNMFYFNKKAYNFIDKIEKKYFMNNYYNLTNLDFLLMIDEAKDLYEVQSNLFFEYETKYASSVWSAFIECLGRDLEKWF